MRDVQEHREVGGLPVHPKSWLIMQESVRRSTPPRVVMWRERLTARYIQRWQKDNIFFTKVEAYAGMSERLVRYLAIEKALQDEIKYTPEHNNHSYGDWCDLSDKEQNKKG